MSDRKKNFRFFCLRARRGTWSFFSIDLFCKEFQRKEIHFGSIKNDGQFLLSMSEAERPLDGWATKEEEARLVCLHVRRC